MIINTIIIIMIIIFITTFVQECSVCPLCDSLGEGVEAVGLLGVGEGHPHAGRERGVEDDGGTLIAGSQVHWRHSADALAVHNHVLGANAVPAGKQIIFLSVYWNATTQGDLEQRHDVSCTAHCSFEVVGCRRIILWSTFNREPLHRRRSNAPTLHNQNWFHQTNSPLLHAAP